MKKLCAVAFSGLLFLSIFSSQLQAQTNSLSSYEVTWHKQSVNSSESMPCGGGDIGLNVWVENGDILFYISRSGTFDENNAMLKLGRVRLNLNPNPFSGNDFMQTLQLEKGRVKITGGGTDVLIWVDVFRPVVHLEVKSPKAVDAIATYENWRFEDFVPVTKEFRSNSFKFPPKNIDVKTHKDNVAFSGNEVMFYHQNRIDTDDAFDITVRQQGMESVKEQMQNPLKNLVFGGTMSGTNMIPDGTVSGKYINTTFKGLRLKSAKPSWSIQLELALYVAKVGDIEQWKVGLEKIKNDAKLNAKTAERKTQDWWSQYWNRSYISIEGNTTDAKWQVGRNYQLFRYMLGCNAYGDYPTKFNGGLFTFDPVFTDSTNLGTPDHRNWGGGLMTAQNQRLVYYPMFKSGDLDMIKPQFDFYLRSLKTAELRSEVYWKHKGACFTEQLENFGLPNMAEYGWKHPADFDKGIEYNAWLEYSWETCLEFCYMMLETERYEGRNISSYIPFIESCLTFFDEHYQMLAKQRGAKIWDGNGNYVFYPSSAAETYKMTYNSTTYISALRVVLTRLTELPNSYLTDEQREKWTLMLKRIPPVPTRTLDGKMKLAPAENWARIQNTETPQLYPVYPWGLYGVDRPDLDVARNTYLYDPFCVKNHHHESWAQAAIFAARLGLTDEAKKYTVLKLQDGKLRFPAFWGPGHDWVPDHNWGGSGMIALQEMLMQTHDRKIILLPAWPKDWNARFKLHAPYNTIVEGEIRNGDILNLKVTPESRRKDVVIWHE
ncbi:DUF5703 domain-containing protein [Parabacteroides sp. FAFU027]|uniref:DUF5703 domain-containing protein n=1 Tax=Parabacteroides sp. FAFU027 TaxID=2922715 RepID=UPI001FAF5C00|nr:DUF5703 domain-containing protein [Parabacteroides sp. FAFU027]